MDKEKQEKKEREKYFQKKNYMLTHFKKWCDSVGCWYETEPYVFDAYKAGAEEFSQGADHLIRIQMEILDDKDDEIAHLKAEIERLSQALILINNIAFAGKDYRGNWRDDIYSVCQRALTNHEEVEG